MFEKIVWAVDTMEPIEFQKNAQAVIHALSTDSSAEVYPVYVHSLLLPTSDIQSHHEQAYIALAEKRFEELKKKSEFAQLQEKTIVISENATTRTSVRKLLECAQRKQADVIVVSTHSHNFMQRFVIGSFAETLLLNSEIPVITVNPKTAARTKISKILFPTDFGIRMRPAFESALGLCAILGAELTVFYKQPFIPVFGSPYDLLAVLESDSQDRKREANHLQDIASAKNVHVDFCMDDTPGNVADAILSYSATHNFDLIAMVSQTSKSGPPHAGSLCRKIVRNAECPVWTFHY